MLLFSESGEVFLNGGKLDICFHELAAYTHLKINHSLSYRCSLLAYIVKKTWAKQTGTTEGLKDSVLAMGIWQLWRYFVSFFNEALSEWRGLIEFSAAER